MSDTTRTKNAIRLADATKTRDPDFWRRSLAEKELAEKYPKLAALSPMMRFSLMWSVWSGARVAEELGVDGLRHGALRDICDLVSKAWNDSSEENE